MNTFGTLLRLTTFGESHGPAMGGILDGMPPMVQIDRAAIARDMHRRRPGSRPDVSARREPDEVEILSGISPEGLTYGTPIGFVIRNRDARPEDYQRQPQPLRPNHADYTWQKKFGYPQLSGGGRASARETASWVAAGAIVRQWLGGMGIIVEGSCKPGSDVAEARRHGDTVGGRVDCRICGLPAGLGEPVFGKFQSRLAAAMMGINAAKAFEYGDGMKSAQMLGSECLDHFKPGLPDPEPCSSNHSGGIQGGITNGMPVVFSVYFKPTPTLMQPVSTVDTNGNYCLMEPKGRHDPCVAIRAVPVVEAMALLVTADMVMAAQIHNSRT